jgi:holliday junction DNA helicase RuvA
MIGRLTGRLLEVDGSMAVVECGGVGYEVQLPESVALALDPGAENVSLLIRQVFREDGVTLYGFLEPFQRRVFDLLMSVKGCGPRIGLALVGQLGAESVAGAVVSQDARALSRANGVGQRLAERIILELREKMAEETFSRRLSATSTTKPKPAQPEDELVDALLALGYRRTEAESAAESARDQAATVEEQLRVALRTLQRGASRERTTTSIRSSRSTSGAPSCRCGRAALASSSVRRS